VQSIQNSTTVYVEFVAILAYQANLVQKKNINDEENIMQI